MVATSERLIEPHIAEDLITPYQVFVDIFEHLPNFSESNPQFDHAPREFCQMKRSQQYLTTSLFTLFPDDFRLTRDSSMKSPLIVRRILHVLNKQGIFTIQDLGNMQEAEFEKEFKKPARKIPSPREFSTTAQLAWAIKDLTTALVSQPQEK